MAAAFRPRTYVGAIFDVIKDSETGILMRTISPRCIAANVIITLVHSGLEGMAMGAQAIV